VLLQYRASLSLPSVLTTEIVLQISFVEIHQDDIRDLLGEGAGYTPIQVRESPERGTYLENAQ
jgi:hypothetical protein